MNRKIDLSDLRSRCMLCARLMHRLGTPEKTMIKEIIIIFIIIIIIIIIIISYNNNNNVDVANSQLHEDQACWHLFVRRSCCF